VFNFNRATPSPDTKGGDINTANIGIFPILTKLGISTTLTFLNPCGINIPHIHPRIIEFLTVVDGKIDFNMIFENDLVIENLSEIINFFNKF
jgi:hypothetical protein